MAGCDSQERAVDVAMENGVLIVANGADPATLDPHLLIGAPEANIVGALSEGLVIHDPDDTGAVRPGVARSWQHSPDYKTWTFNLRKDARWSDGQPLTAQDFVFSFQRMLAPKLGAEGADLLHVIRNARAYNRGELTDFAQVGIAAPDPYRLVLTLEYPAPYLLPMLAGTAFVPVNQAAVQAGGRIDDADNRWASAGTYVGNGPFLLSEWRVNRFVLLERNPQYWDAGNVALNAVRFVPLGERDAEVTAFIKGDVHVTQSFTGSEIAELKRKRPNAVVTEDMLGAYVYVFNLQQRPFDDVRVRRALALAIDRQKLVEKLGGDRQAIGGFVPPGIPGYDHIGPPAPDVAKARRLLAEAGYPDGRGFPETTILINEFDIHQSVAEAVIAMWRDGLGINVGIRARSWKDYLAASRDRQFQIARSGWVAGYLDPGAFLDILASGGRNNEAGWADPRYDALIAEARAMSDQSSRMATMRKAEDLMLAQQPLIPLLNYSQTYLLDPRVKGWGHSINGNRVYKFMSFSSN
ncbi:peptide ABC transporter substrate-binding protein [Croceicoccus ponticola]|uniref:Peptide ABC transporter substrate-binding protein n=1 Tax=Croceicoccus ponticola TaxID=2217664 RepID=A0A437GWN9_9SPHN|nr:peptide ABC transporter substrate-binding protein [Croceicoccus ponticola]RVQ65333.1 peptide ABC transporter substrate-binding protein [Croceicoccus ponticola]